MGVGIAGCHNGDRLNGTQGCVKNLFPKERESLHHRNIEQGALNQRPAPLLHEKSRRLAFCGRIGLCPVPL